MLTEKHVYFKIWLVHICASNCMHVYAWISTGIADDIYDTLSTTVSPMQRCFRLISAFVHAVYLHGDMLP